ncbi:MAG: HNH endonuclease [Verrucomicrobiales bacterium]|nr:HNH endonuclease [Verrucomicrobiales bacterium]
MAPPSGELVSITRFYEEVLGGDLKNPRWSWGAIDPVMHRIYLRVWEDQIVNFDGQDWVQVFNRARPEITAGHRERAGHLDAMRGGADGFGVVCRAVAPGSTGSRRIASFDRTALLRLGHLRDEGTFVYAAILGRMPVEELTRRQTANGTLAADLKSLLSRKFPESTTKEALIDARVGQGWFRSAVLCEWGNRCAVTGSTTLDAIRASHIKPWRDSNDSERLNPHNGLPLVASLDALFDCGLISFDEAGGMLVSCRMPDREQQIFGLHGLQLARQPRPEMLAFLKHHRDTQYLG